MNWLASSETAQIEERAAGLEKEASEAKLELARLSTPRVKLLTPEAVESPVEQLKQYAGTKIDIGHDARGREHWDFLWQLEPVFQKTG